MMSAPFSLFLLAACAPHLYTGGPAEEWTAPDNRWPHGDTPADLQGEGFAEGQVPPELRDVDQFGDEVSLWQFYGSVVLVDISTIWCAPCQDLAADVQATADDFAGGGFVYLTVLAEDLERVPPSVEELGEWADYFGIESPILSDGEGWSYRVVTDGTYPRLLLLGRDLAILDSRVEPATDSRIREVVEQAL